MSKIYTVNFMQIAEKDLVEIVDYISDDSIEQALKIFHKIKSKVDSLEKFPEKGRIVPELKYFNQLSYRELIVTPWRIIYKIENDTVYILAVFDSRRNIEDILLQRVLSQH